MQTIVNVLISSVGNRSQLLGCFRQSLRALGLEGSLYAVDCSRTAPAAYLADRFLQVPRCTAPEFVPTMLRICQKHSISLLVPRIDTELAVYAAHREDFAAAGTTVVISSQETVEVTSDKVKTHGWLVEKGVPTLRQALPADVLSQPDSWEFPVVAKPRRGSASVGVRLVRSPAELQFLCEERDDLIVQERAREAEHTINVFVSRDGRCLCAVPHLRIEVRAGEVSKAVTVKHGPMMELARQVAEALPGAYGPLNIQCFLASDGQIRLSEINPRFGGGYPLAHRAGAAFTRWLLEERLGRPASASFNDWKEGLTMLRYDQAVFLSRSETLVASDEEETVCRV